MRGKEILALLDEQRRYPSPIEEVLDHVVAETGKAHESKDIDDLLRLARSKRTVQNEEFWADLIDQVEHAREMFISKGKRKELDADLVFGALMAIDAILRIPSTVEVRLKEAENTSQRVQKLKEWTERGPGRKVANG